MWYSLATFDIGSHAFGNIFYGFDAFDFWIALVFFCGLFLATLSDDSEGQSLRLTWLATEMLPFNLNYSMSKDIHLAYATKNPFFYPMFIFFKELYAAIIDKQLVHYLQSCYDSCYKAVSQYIYYYYLNYTAKSKRQFLYLLEKSHLGLPIQRNETEHDSYLDIKRYLSKRKIWPFMSVVYDVKNSKINCNGYVAVPMSSYSYLDFLRDTKVQNAALDAAKIWSTGNHGPRMLGGNASILCDLEKSVADFFGREGSLVFATGFMACMSAICAVCTEKDLIVADSRSHASLRTGIQLCGAKAVYFKHNDFKKCASILSKLRKKYNSCWIIVESVYSMDGDMADLPAAYNCCQKYDAKLLIDEAHGLGVLGKTGRGIEEHYDMKNCATLIVGTFSKSAAGIGGYITGEKDLIDFLDFHTPGNVFSAPLTAYSAGGVLEALRLIDVESWRVKKCQENAKYLRNALIKGLDMFPPGYPSKHKYEVRGDCNTPVIPVIIKRDIDRVLKVAAAMLAKGWMLSAVAYPACPFETPRFRVTSNTSLDEKTMDAFILSLVECCINCPPSVLK